MSSNTQLTLKFLPLSYNFFQFALISKRWLHTAILWSAPAPTSHLIYRSPSCFFPYGLLDDKADCPIAFPPVWGFCSLHAHVTCSAPWYFLTNWQIELDIWSESSLSFWQAYYMGGVGVIFPPCFTSGNTCCLLVASFEMLAALEGCCLGLLC